MSSESANARPKRDGERKRGRSRGPRNKNNRTKQSDDGGAGGNSYEGVSFRKRHSSGQPGSPHRYFEHSYDVVFQDDEGEANDCADERRPPPSPEEPRNGVANPAYDDDERGNQVVHRHLNGLCVVTAGNVLENVTSGPKRAGSGEVAVSSIRFLVRVGEDSLSAKGKMRAKNKRRRRRATAKEGDDDDAGQSEDRHDGNVSSRDPLCEATLSDGTTVRLDCCVEGTVVELNRRLLGPESAEDSGRRSDSDEEGGEASDKRGRIEVDDGGPSLVSKEPLLDGYLAVIMPTKGSFPPKGKEPNVRSKLEDAAVAVSLQK